MRFLGFLTNGRFSAFEEDRYFVVLAKDLEVDLVERVVLEVDLKIS